uniref:Neprilysin n=1 Tax=Hemiscolopendra marginata TaxID=943146 RepID=A0A646QFK1_9MYRI
MFLSIVKEKLASLTGLLLLLLVFAFLDITITLETKPPINQNDTLWCNKTDCIEAAATLRSHMDLNIDPCKDFYQFACGGFQKKYINRTKNFRLNDTLSIEMRIKLKELLTSTNKKNESRVFWKLRDYYSSCLNAESYSDKHKKSLLKLIDKYGGWPILKGESWNETKFSWQYASAKLVSEGFNIASILGVYLYVNHKHTVTENYRVIQIARNHYTERYISGQNESDPQLIEDVATYLGASNDLMKQEIKELINFYENYSEILKKEIEHPEKYLSFLTTVADLYNISKEVDWLKYFQLMFPVSIRNNTPVFRQVLEAKIKSMVSLLMKTPSRVLANFVMWKVIYGAIILMQNPKDLKLENIIDAVSPYFSPTVNRPQDQCLKEVIHYLTPALTALYVRNYIPEGYKTEVHQIFAEMKISAGIIIKDTDWLHNNTMNCLNTDLAKMQIVSPYPDDLMDDKKLAKYYEKLTVSKTDYLLNKIHLRTFLHRIKSHEILMNGSRYQWTEIMPILNIDAGHVKKRNTLNYSLIQMRGHYHSADRLRALNFGSLGSALAHEMFLILNQFGFVEGQHISNWWKPQDTIALLNRSNCMKLQYEQFELGNDGRSNRRVRVNGSKTLEENLSDNYGVKAAYMAYQSWLEDNKEKDPLKGLTNFTGNQLFWIAFASNWCSTSGVNHFGDPRKYEKHPPELYRVLVTLQNQAEFARDFNCKKDTRMNPSEKCVIW